MYGNWINSVEIKGNSIIVNSGSICEKVSIVKVCAGSSIELVVNTGEAKNYLLRICEVIPDEKREVCYGM